jgi:branched-chain amino acid transport system ATP-binding protein
VLEVSRLRSGYGRGPDVLLDASIEVRGGEIVSLVGLNGAGKSTLVRTIAGLLLARSGVVSFEGSDITRLSADARARRGVLLVPEGRELALSMTVAENLALGTVPLPPAKRRTQGAENYALVYDLFPILAEKRQQPASSLSGGQQQMVAVGRALMGSPRLLVLDEPSLGLAPLLVQEIFEAIAKLNSNGLSVLLVEQNAALAIKYSDRAYHLELGSVTPTDAGAEERSLLSHGDIGGAAEGNIESIDLPHYQKIRRTTEEAATT